MGKAFIFTLDAILAIIVCSILFVLTYHVLTKFQYSVVRTTELDDVCSDVLASLEKNHTLQNSIYYSRTSDIREVLNNLSSTVCSGIVIYSSQNAPLLVTQRADCNCTGSRSLVVRSFVIPNSNGTLSEYLAKMEACYR
ncbi:hypothetical protein H0N99_03100 [Candidatus Micrarchaeota archaeon]|nr:hypothetical protein [Candidatus Micrarchaeota archaeon]